jgi:hypothetical protein
MSGGAALELELQLRQSENWGLGIWSDARSQMSRHCAASLCEGGTFTTSAERAPLSVFYFPCACTGTSRSAERAAAPHICLRHRREACVKLLPEVRNFTNGALKACKAQCGYSVLGLVTCALFYGLLLAMTCGEPWQEEACTPVYEIIESLTYSLCVFIRML